MSTSSNLDWISEIVNDLPPLVRTGEACKALRLSPRTLSRYVRAGRIAGVRAVHGGSSRTFIPRAAIETYLRGMIGGAS
jgi:excisionase family DNA binding protein